MSFFEDLPVYDTALLTEWPEMQAILAQSREMVRADPIISPLVNVDQLGRVVLSMIEPNGHIQWHHDTGKYIEATLRFHIPFETDDGAINYEPDGEHRHMKVGELTWIDNRGLHSAVNWSDRWRTHAVFEFRCRN